MPDPDPTPAAMKCPLCNGNFRRLIRHLSRAGKTFKIATNTLPPQTTPLQIRTRRQKNWRDGGLLEGKGGKIYWEYWENGAIRLRGVNPGDQWRLPHSNKFSIVKEYKESTP